MPTPPIRRGRRQGRLIIAGTVPAESEPTHVSKRFVLFTVLVALNLFDVYVTRLGIERGVLREVNPLMQVAIESFWTATWVKLVTLGVVAVALRSLRPRFAVMEWVLAVGVGWYIAVVGWNTGIVLAG